MPKVTNGPKELNDLLESVYANCMKESKNEARCAATAWSAAKNAGWRLGKDKKWHKKENKKKEN